MLVQAIQNQITKRSGTIVTNGVFNMFGGTLTSGGKTVSANHALTISAFYNGINILCNDYAKLPKTVMRYAQGKRESMPDHAVQYLIHEKPNAFMNAFDFDAIMLKSAILKGNGYALIVRNAMGNAVSIEYIDENKTPVVVRKFQGRLYYTFGGNTYAAEDIIHFRSLFSDNGVTGIGIVTFAAKSLGVALSSQDFAEDYYNSKGIGLGVVNTAKDIPDPDQKKKLGDAISNALTSANGKFGVAVLDEMASFQHIKLTPQESLFLETNKHAVEEVARWLNIPVYKLKITENQNNSNMENQSISHVSDCILPFAKKMAQEYNAKLFTSVERKAGLRVKFNTNSLLQADKKTQSEWYMRMLYSGVMTRNEIRELEDLNPIAGLDDPLTPVNMQTMQQLQQTINNNGNE